MGCFIKRKYYLHTIEGIIGGNLCKIFYETREREYKKEQQLIHLFSHELSHEGEVVFGAVTSNLPILSQNIAKLIQQLICDNIYFQDKQYIEGFENIIEILISTLNSPIGQIDHILSEIPIKNIQQIRLLDASISFTLKLKNRMYFATEIGTKQEKIYFPQAKYIVFPAQGKQFEFIPSKGQIEGVTSLNNCVFELNPEIASNLSGLILTDSYNRSNFNMEMSTLNNERFSFDSNTHMLKVDFSNSKNESIKDETYDHSRMTCSQ